MKCAASYPSSVCPGTVKLDKELNGSPFDLRCRECKFRVGQIDIGFDQNKRIDLIKKKLQQTQQGFGKNTSREIGSWESFAESMLVDLFYEAAGMRPGIGNAALVSCGSLGRREATPHSDLEFFLLVEKTDQPLVEKGFGIANKMYEFAESIHAATGIFGEDHNFKRGRGHICMSVEGKHLEPGFRNQLVITTVDLHDFILWSNLVGGHVVMGQPQMYEQFRNMVVQLTHNRELIVGRLENDLLLVGTGGSVFDKWKKREVKTKINIKAHLLRPCTYTIVYLGAYFQVDGSGDRIHLHKLKQKGYVSDAVARMIETTMQTAEQWRWKSHLEHKGEVDDIDLATIKEMNQRTEILNCVNNVSSLLALADAWIKLQRTPPKKSFFSFGKQAESPYLTQNPGKYRYVPFDQDRPKN